MSNWRYESEELSSATDINGTEIKKGDVVYYSGASDNKGFSIATIDWIENYKTFYKDKEYSSSIIVHLGKKRTRQPEQLIKKL